MALTTSINSALAAYNNVAKSIGGDSAGPEIASTEGGTSFSSLLGQGAQAAVNAGKKSEEMSKQAITGKADIPDVVAAVSNAELTLQTVVAVRDKVVSAYNDILRMSF